MPTPEGSIHSVANALLQPSEPEQPTEEEVETPEVEEVEAEVTEEVTEEEETPQTYTVKVQGEEQEVSLDDLLSGYMLHSDYTKKTMDLSEQRKATEERLAELSQAVEQAKLLSQLEMEDLASPEALQLKEDDPQAYYERRERNEARQQRLDEFSGTLGKEQEAKRAAKIAEEQELLGSAIPEWVDPDAANSDIKAMQLLWSDAGYKPDEVGQFIDHRWMVISRKAALYDQIMSTEVEGKKVAPKNAEPKASTTREDAGTRKQKELRDRVRKTGKMEDAQRALLNLIEGK